MAMQNMEDDPKNLIINFIPQEFDELQIEEMFAQCGTIEKFTLLRDRRNQRSLGYAFCKYETKESAALAISRFSGMQLMGKTLKVAVAKNREAHSRKCNIYIASIPLHWGEENLKQRFAQFGEITHCKILRHNHNGTSRGAGFIHFSTLEAADAAIAGMNGQIPNDGSQALIVKYGQKQESCRDSSQMQQMQTVGMGGPGVTQFAGKMKHGIPPAAARYNPYGVGLMGGYMPPNRMMNHMAAARGRGRGGGMWGPTGGQAHPMQAMRGAAYGGRPPAPAQPPPGYF